MDQTAVLFLVSIDVLVEKTMKLLTKYIRSTSLTLATSLHGVVVLEIGLSL